jgi:hypothetical protein
MIFISGRGRTRPGFFRDPEVPTGTSTCVVGNRLWVRFLKSKDETCSQLETILLDTHNTHARYHLHVLAFAPFMKFDSDCVFDASNTQLMCSRLGFCTPFSAPYAHHMVGKAERPWRTLRDSASTMLHAMFVPNNMWSCAIITLVHLRNRTFSRAVGPPEGVPLTLLNYTKLET